MTVISSPIRNDGDHVSLFFSQCGENVDLAYLGPRLPAGENLSELLISGQYGRHENQPDNPPISGIFPQLRGGYDGQAAITLGRMDQIVNSDFKLVAMAGFPRKVSFTWIDQLAGLQVDQFWEIRSSDIVRVTTELIADDDDAAMIRAASKLVLPLPARFDRLIWYPGRWANEAQEVELSVGLHTIDMSTHAGKPGFDGGNWIVLLDSGQGDCIGIHTSSFGNHSVQVTRDDDGRVVASLSTHFADSERSLADDGSDDLGFVEFCYAPDRNELTRRFQAYVRNDILPDRKNWGPRKVHLNSWEALGFDLNEPALMQLADDAASLGIERFVLDDGWFKGRRNDRAGLGDWTVDQTIFPNGLKPLIDHVKSLDMDFGLWVEPEMISPNSDLYRAHPDWCLHNSGDNRPTERNQLVLDLCQPEVFQYIVDALDTLLRNNDISYLKWDHNRRLFPDNGLQQSAIRNLLQHMRRTWPDVEIEICSSGGGRISTAYLEHCHRVWPSDNNDPIERLSIMQSWNRFLPLEVLGNHVGPSPNPITGRQIAMDFRAKVAMFGHMGVEANPADMSDADLICLAAHIGLYKEWRHLLHGGNYMQLNHPDTGIFAHMVASDDTAIGLAAQTRFGKQFNAASLRLKGLDADAVYRIQLPKPWPKKASGYLANAALWERGLNLSGQALMQTGLALPLTHPETAWIFTLERIDA